MDVTTNNVDNSGVRLTAVAEQIDCHPIIEVKSCVCTNVKYRVVQQLLYESITRRAQTNNKNNKHIILSNIALHDFSIVNKVIHLFFFPPSVRRL